LVLQDTYVHDGAVLLGAELAKSRLPVSVRQHLSTYQPRFGTTYKQLNAPFGHVCDEHVAGLDARDQERQCVGRQPYYNSIEDQIATADHVARCAWPRRSRTPSTGRSSTAPAVNEAQAHSWIAQVQRASSFQAQVDGGRPT